MPLAPVAANCWLAERIAVPAEAVYASSASGLTEVIVLPFAMPNIPINSVLATVVVTEGAVMVVLDVFACPPLISIGEPLSTPV